MSPRRAGQRESATNGSATMTLTRGSFTYSNGEEYHGEWKEGKTDSTDPPPPPHHHSTVHPPSWAPFACTAQPLL
ncbi:hypothetical protein INR49_001876 [Caranx melampygus]|nr:hypothetical protein INR49_001876 [Caranx melampygus]